MEQLQNLDIKLLKYIYLHRYIDADNFLIWITEHTTYLTVSLIIFIFSYGIIKKNINLQKKALLISIAIITSAIIVNLLKLIFKRERAYDIYNFLHVKIDAGGYSFPSGHTTEVFALAIAVSYLFPSKIVRYIVYFWAFLIAYTRIALGVHYPGDVLVGIFIGTITSIYIIKFLNKKFG